MTRKLDVGFMPLVDAAPLIAAVECGFAVTEGILLNPVRQASWASLRDHLNLGHLDCAQALAPLPIAAALGIGQVRADMAVPFVLSRGGNAITLSVRLTDEIRRANNGDNPGDARAWARALAIAMRQRSEPVTLAMVYPFSGHNYEIRYWLASAGIHPDRDLRLVAIPPPLMVDSLRAGQIDGFCVGAPWNSIAAAEGVGEIVATKSEIFPHGIEKVLAMLPPLLEDAPTLRALLRALSAAAKWCDQPRNHGRLAELLARPDYLGTDPEYSLRALGGDLKMAGAAADRDYLYFSRLDANRPRRLEALWVYSQMRRWGQTTAEPQGELAAAAVYRPDIYARALDIEPPAADALPDDPPIESCDQIRFDGRPVPAYLELFDIATPYGSSFADL